MAITAVEEQLAEIGRRIDQLDTRAGAGAAEAKSRIQRHLDTLRHRVSEYAKATEDKLRQLEIKLDIAEHRLASELAGDARTFVDAVEAELHDWDTYVEWLQMKAATKAKAGSAREQAEAAIRELRQRRNTVAEPPCRCPCRPGRGVARAEEACHRGARGAGRKADEVSAKFD